MRFILESRAVEISLKYEIQFPYDIALEIEECLMNCQEMTRSRIPPLKHNLNLHFQFGSLCAPAQECPLPKLPDSAFAGGKSHF
jgi:hypothetical protein